MISCCAYFRPAHQQNLQVATTIAELLAIGTATGDVASSRPAVDSRGAGAYPFREETRDVPSAHVHFQLIFRQFVETRLSGVSGCPGEIHSYLGRRIPGVFGQGRYNTIRSAVALGI